MSGHALVVGEALVDIVHRGDDNPVEHVGGSPLNVAVGLGRLARPVHFVTRLAPDDRGRRIIDHLDASGVRLTPGSAAAAHTATAKAMLDRQGRATYDFDIDWHPVLPPPTVDAILIHTGSIATVLEPGCDTVAELVAQQSAASTVSFDPNIRPALIRDEARGRARIERLVGLADIVKASDEDLAWFAPGQDPVETAREWLRRGPAIVVVTRGAGGALAMNSVGTVEIPAMKVDVVDTVGAGDAFTAGLLDSLWTQNLLGADRRENLHRIGLDALRVALETAAWTSALTVGRAGADLPTRDERDRAVRS